MVARPKARHIVLPYPAAPAAPTPPPTGTPRLWRWGPVWRWEVFFQGAKSKSGPVAHGWAFRKRTAQDRMRASGRAGLAQFRR